MCDKEFIWNHSNWECEFDKSCYTGEYLDYTNSKCRNKLVDKLVEEGGGNIDGNQITSNETLNDYEKMCNSCAICIVLFITFIIISISISKDFIYFHWYSKGWYIETTIY